MNAEPVVRQKYVWDPITKLTRNYQKKINATYREIDEHVRTGRADKVTTPNYAREVIAPLAKALSDALPEYAVTVKDSVEVIGSEAYFMLQLGELSLGGLSYPGPKMTQINFTIFAHQKPWGRSIAITKLSQLTKLLVELANFVKPGGINEHEDD